MMRKLIIFGFVLLLQTVVIPSSYAWKVPLEVTTTVDGEKVYNKLVVGIEPDATDNFDNLWDTPAILSHPDSENHILMEAYLNGKGNGPEGTKHLWKDIRGTATKGDTAWDITIDYVSAGKSVVISWNAPQGLLKKGERLVLKDNDSSGSDGQPIQVDMTAASNYTFESAGGEPRSLSMVLSKEAANNTSSGGGSGFGCGTVRPHTGGGPSNGLIALFNMTLLFAPVLFFRLIRLTR